MHSDLDLRLREDGQVSVVRPRGTLTTHTAPLLRRTLVKGLLGLGRVVVELDVFRLGRASCVKVFPAVLDHCGGWPRARLTLCRPDEDMAQALRTHEVPAFVPVRHDFLDSVAAFEYRPPKVRVRTRLACDHRAPGIARRIVRESCPTWQVGRDRQGLLELLASELVSNAVSHARTASTLTLERGPDVLRVAVRDNAPAGELDRLSRPERRSSPGQSSPEQSSPEQSSPEQSSPGTTSLGRGLAMVEALSSRWGLTAHSVGKTVWAEVGE